METYKKWLRLFISAIAVFLLTIAIASIREVAAHNRAALYGETTEYSGYNIVVAFSNLLTAKGE